MAKRLAYVFFRECKEPQQIVVHLIAVTGFRPQMDNGMSHPKALPKGACFGRADQRVDTFSNPRLLRMENVPQHEDFPKTLGSASLRPFHRLKPAPGVLRRDPMLEVGHEMYAELGAE